MRVEARLFEILTGFFVLTAVAYGGLTAVFARGGLEWAGTTALVLTAGLSLIIGTFFRFVARRLDTRPEDWWPILIALAFSTAAIGAALWLPWLIVSGVVMVLAAVSGLVFEYYVGPEKH
jgi:hypothetical protein